MDAYDVSGKPFTSINKSASIEGSAMLSDEWNEGMVVFERGYSINKIAIRFNLYENELYFKKDSVIYTFADAVREFTIPFNDEGQIRILKFRNGYTPQHKRTLNSFYQVLVDGKNAQLLKYVSKIVRENWEYSRPVKKYYEQKEELFIQDNMTGQLTAIKKDKQSLIKALPSHASSINKLAKDNDLDLNTEAGLKRLIELLNS